MYTLFSPCLTRWTPLSLPESEALLVPRKNFCEQEKWVRHLPRGTPRRPRWPAPAGSRFGPRPARVDAATRAFARPPAPAHRTHTRSCASSSTFAWPSTSTTQAQFCTLRLTCPPDSGSGGRRGQHWARHRRSRPCLAPRRPTQGPQAAQHHAAGRFAGALQFAG